METLLSPAYLVMAYDLMMMYYVILAGLALIGTHREFARFGVAFLFVGLSTWAGITGLIGPDVAQ